ncbi:MAG: DUF465 domain-containing protein [Deltaproteobacteria bacterium CG07_land_8_20_14_0_80_38_7]|nr:MAG: DUF465 domain-containing protein [Deltaproteobacteria bacterium CG07_land_8_20_14_0_80_38_7]
MEQRDLELIEKYGKDDLKLRKLYDEHLDLERQLESYFEKSYLTPQDQLERARLKKMKLKGRDEIEIILSKYRKVEGCRSITPAKQNDRL